MAERGYVSSERRNFTRGINIRGENGVLVIDSAKVFVVEGELHFKGLDASSKTNFCFSLWLYNNITMNILGVQAVIRPDDQDLTFGDLEEAKPADLETKHLL